jgi:hypothetical protein
MQIKVKSEVRKAAGMKKSLLRYRPDNGDSKYIRNVGLVRDYKALYPRRVTPSHSGGVWECGVEENITICRREIK